MVLLLSREASVAHVACCVRVKLSLQRGTTTNASFSGWLLLFAFPVRQKCTVFTSSMPEWCISQAVINPVSLKLHCRLVSMLLPDFVVMASLCKPNCVHCSAVVPR